MGRAGVHQDERVGGDGVVAAVQGEDFGGFACGFGEEGKDAVKAEGLVHDGADVAVKEFGEVGLEGPLAVGAVAKDSVDVRLYRPLELGTAG